MVAHWARLLSAVFLSLVSTSSFGVHTDYFLKDEAEARAASVWACGYVQLNGIWATLGEAMSMETCMSLAREKVVELGAAWSAQAPPGTRYCTPPPVRDDVCSKGPLTTAPDPVTGFPVGVYALKCYARQTLQCVETFAGGVGIAGGAQMHAGVIGIKGHPDPFKSADVYLLADVPPPVADKCPVDDIPPFGPPDPPELDMTNITPGTRAAADCLLSALGIVNLDGAGDVAVFESGYRTLDYQRHFVALWDKKRELEREADPLCADLQKKINDDFNRHGLGKSKVRPADGASCHSSGTCFDVKSAYIPGVDQNAFACKIRRPLPVDDPIHVVPY